MSQNKLYKLIPFVLIFLLGIFYPKRVFAEVNCSFAVRNVISEHVDLVVSNCSEEAYLEVIIYKNTEGGIEHYRQAFQIKPTEQFTLGTEFSELGLYFAGLYHQGNKISSTTFNVISQSNPDQDVAIRFNEIQTKIPGLNPVFTQGASGVYPILSTVLTYVYVIAGLILLFSLIAGGFQMMLGASDEKGLVAAKARITQALVGFLILFLSYWIVQIVEYVLGIKIF